MTLDEATAIARIIGTADGGCSNCVGDLVDQMQAAFPEFDWVMRGYGEYSGLENKVGVAPREDGAQPKG